MYSTCCVTFCGFADVVVGFERHTYRVRERRRQVELCVKITVPGPENIGTITFNLTVETQDGSAGILCTTHISWFVCREVLLVSKNRPEFAVFPSMTYYRHSLFHLI